MELIKRHLRGQALFPVYVTGFAGQGDPAREPQILAKPRKPFTGIDPAKPPVNRDSAGFQRGTQTVEGAGPAWRRGSGTVIGRPGLTISGRPLSVDQVPVVIHPDPTILGSLRIKGHLPRHRPRGGRDVDIVDVGPLEVDCCRRQPGYRAPGHGVVQVEKGPGVEPRRWC